MNFVPIGQRIGKRLILIFGPLVRLFCWWRSHVSEGATYFVMPDATALFVVLLAPFYFIPVWDLINLPGAICSVVLWPFLFLQIVRIKHGNVVCVRSLVVLPYWFVRIPDDSEFEIYEAWGDLKPSGVAFKLPRKAGEYLHLGTAATAESLANAMGQELIRQGWRATPKNTAALMRHVE